MDLIVNQHAPGAEDKALDNAGLERKLAELERQLEEAQQRTLQAQHETEGIRRESQRRLGLQTSSAEIGALMNAERIRQDTDAADIAVLSPYFGSRSTGAAAMALRRKDPAAYDRMRQRAQELGLLPSGSGGRQSTPRTFDGGQERKRFGQ